MFRKSFVFALAIFTPLAGCDQQYTNEDKISVSKCFNAKQAPLDVKVVSELINRMLRHEELPYVVGSSWSPFHGLFGKNNERPWTPFHDTAAEDFLAIYDQIQDDVFLRACEALKDKGPITDYQLKMAMGAKSRMNLSTTVPEFKKAAQEYAHYINSRGDIMSATDMGPEEAKK